jgi:hypothetical protein
MKARTTFLLIFLINLLNLNAQTIIEGGAVYGDWKIGGSPFLIEGDIYVPSDQRLTIKPGVTVVFQGLFGFVIEGKLEAAGTQSDSITFTIHDTIGFSVGEYIGWNGLIFDGMNYSYAEPSILRFCNIEFSENNGITCISYPDLIIDHTSIRNNNSSGLVLYELSDIVVENVTIRNNRSQGLKAVSSSPQFLNFIIKNNSGSGVLISGSNSGSVVPTFINGKIMNNTTMNNGGGVNVDIDANVYFENVEIKSNTAVKGGGIYVGMAGGVFNHVVVHDNKADKGAGIYGNYDADVTLNYCLFSKNIADYTGGGAFIDNGKINFYNCTLSGNAAGEIGGGLFYNCFFVLQNEIRNSILWNNIPNEIEVLTFGPIASYSDIKDGFTGIDNIDEDPLFVDPLNNNYLLSWGNFPDENGLKSPCIDSGDPNSTFDPDGTYSDIGAFYFDQGFYTSITDEDSAGKILVYPNPAQNFINIKGISGSERVIISNMTGETVISQSVANDIQNIDISSLNPGIYLIRVDLKNNKIISKKIVKN